MDYQQEFTDKVRAIVGHELKKCTPAQIDIFNKMYKGIQHIELDKMCWAYQQIKRTLEKNK
jgi:hypothetical protein